MVAAVTGIFSGFFNAAGSHLWELVRKRVDPPSPPPRERYFVEHSQFEGWRGREREVVDALQACGEYDFVCIDGHLAPIREAQGWEKLLVEDKEIWWLNPQTRLPHAFMMRKRSR